MGRDTRAFLIRRLHAKLVVKTNLPSTVGFTFIGRPLTHFLYMCREPSIIAKNFGGLLVGANVYGYLLTLFAYAKAHIAPSHPGDRKFSGKDFSSDGRSPYEFAPSYTPLYFYRFFRL